MNLDITKLIGEGEVMEYKGMTLQVKPLSVREQAKLAELQKQEKFDQASEFLFIATLKKADPSLTDDQILSITDTEFITQLGKAILKVNGLSVPSNFPQESQPQ